MTITIKDEAFTGEVLNELLLEFQAEKVSIRDIITERVNCEVRLYNERVTEYFTGLVEPLEAEKSLNGYKLRPKQIIDAEKQVYVALDAFQKNGFFVLIDDVQSESLNQEVLLSPDTRISFVKLTPLVGG